MIWGLVRVPGAPLLDWTSGALGGGSARNPTENAKSIAQANQHITLNWNPGFFIRRGASRVKA
jgi:hypothetical protein